MKHFILILIVFFCTKLVFAVDSVTSRYTKSPLKERYEADYNFKNNSNSTFDFPLQSVDKFVSTLDNYLTSESKEQSLLLYRHKDGNLEVNVLGGVDYVSNFNKDYFFLYYGLDTKVNYRNIFFSGRCFKGHTSNNNDFSRDFYLINSWVQTEENRIYVDKIEGEIRYQMDSQSFVSLQRNKICIGSNISSSIILNDQLTNDYTFFNYHVTLGQFSLDFYHASLISDSTNVFTDNGSLISKSNNPDKYLAIHKFNWNPNEKLSLFMGEELFYGNRNIDFNYFIPLGFWRVTEHNQGDKDNILIFAGLDYQPVTKYSLYFNLIFDEMTKSKLFTSWWGNKYAVQTGIVKNNIYRNNFISWNRVGIEFTAVRPWIYTHKFLYTKVSNDGQPLGYSDGTNIIKYTFETDFSFLKGKINYVVNASYARQGDFANNFDINYAEVIDNTDDYQTTWLQGNIIDTYSLKNKLAFNFLYSHSFIVSFEYEYVRQAEIDRQLIFSYQTRF